MIRIVSKYEPSGECKVVFEYWDTFPELYPKMWLADRYKRLEYPLDIFLSVRSIRLLEKRRLHFPRYRMRRYPFP